MVDREKPLEWIASSYKDLMVLPALVRRRFGYALSLAQLGDQDDAAKVLKGYVFSPPFGSVLSDEILANQ